MKASVIAAKIAVRIFFILLLVAMAVVFQNGGASKNWGYINLLQWQLIFPVLLIVGFVVLLLLATVKKYRHPDINWLLVINTTMLIAYGVAVFIRIRHIGH